MTQELPYCGLAPLPGELPSRFNVDPVLIAGLVCVCLAQLVWLRHRSRFEVRRRQAFAVAGWSVAAAAFLSPLCALSVALLSARVGQHMVLSLIAAPLIAMGLPRGPAWTHMRRLWVSASIFLIALWYWHMPDPYAATFDSSRMYWAMHITLFGSSIFLWRELLDHPAHQTTQVLAAGSLTFLQMGLLGAMLTLADRPLFQWHATTTLAWGLTPLQDQQLAGTIMWVPGIALFLWIAVRSLNSMWQAIERTRPA